MGGQEMEKCKVRLGALKDPAVVVTTMKKAEAKAKTTTHMGLKRTVPSVPCYFTLLMMMFLSA